MAYIYGMHPVLELLGSQANNVEALWVLGGVSETRLVPVHQHAARRGLRVEVATKRRLLELCGSPHHQGVVAQTQPFAYASLEALAPQRGAPPPLVVVLDQIQDPHNLGSLIRSACALGASGMVLCRDRACEVTPAVVKVAAGATAHLPIVQVVNLCRALKALQAAGLWVTGTTVDAPQTLDALDLSGPVALVLGSEATGLRPQVRKTCDHVARIATSCALGSLGVAVAGGIALFAAAQKRQRGATLTP